MFRTKFFISALLLALAVTVTSVPALAQDAAFELPSWAYPTIDEGRGGQRRPGAECDARLGRDSGPGFPGSASGLELDSLSPPREDLQNKSLPNPSIHKPSGD